MLRSSACKAREREDVLLLLERQILLDIDLHSSQHEWLEDTVQLADCRSRCRSDFSASVGGRTEIEPILERFDVVKDFRHDVAQQRPKLRKVVLSG